jgi:ATP-dependent 26S proteasome regulatory subunit
MKYNINVDLHNMSKSELNEFILWAKTKISSAETILATSAKFKSRAKSESYKKMKEKQDRIGEVAKLTLKVGDIVKVMGSKNHYPGIIVSTDKSKLVLGRGDLYNLTQKGYVPITQTEHMWNKVRAIYNKQKNKWEYFS